MAVKAAARVGALEEVDLLVREVERGLDQCAQFDDSLGQCIDLARERATERAGGRARRGLGAGIDQVGDGFGLRQVEFAVEERALRELAWLRQAQMRQSRALRGGFDFGAGLETARQQQLQYHRSAMGLQLEDVFAGIRTRRREVERQTAVDGLAPGVAQHGQMRRAWREAAAGKRFDQAFEATPRHAHDAHRAAARRGGDRDDRVLWQVQE